MNMLSSFKSEDFDSDKLQKTLSLLELPIVGVDEVGRGCLAGPVYAAAVCFKSDNLPAGMTDSKLLSEPRRELIAEFIKTHHYYGIASASVEEVDELNILQASFVAMRRAVTELEKSMKGSTGVLLVDGHMPVKGYSGRQIPVVKGDLRVPMIAAASIVAKVARDHLMKEIDNEFPHFGFAKHKGYGSPAHRKVIAEQGPCLYHRKSFKGVKEYII